MDLFDPLPALIADDLLTGLVAYLRSAEIPRHRSHMPERFGLFTLIVLGESVIAVSAGTAQAAWVVGSVLAAGLGFTLAALWWVYFARFDDDVFNWALAGGNSERRRAFLFGYGHLIVFAALAAVGVGIRLGVEEAIDGRHAAQAYVGSVGYTRAGARSGVPATGASQSMR